jgi:hypothetical protein
MRHRPQCYCGSWAGQIVEDYVRAGYAAVNTIFGTDWRPKVDWIQKTFGISLGSMSSGHYYDLQFPEKAEAGAMVMAMQER